MDNVHFYIHLVVYMFECIYVFLHMAISDLYTCAVILLIDRPQIKILCNMSHWMHMDITYIHFIFVYVMTVLHLVHDVVSAHSA